VKIFILAGGFGTRLRSVVSDLPKPMAPVNGLPFLEYQIKEVRKFYPNTIIYLLTHYLSEKIEEHFKMDPLVEIIKEDQALGTGGSINNALKLLNCSQYESLLVLNGDTYIKPDLETFIYNATSDVNLIGSLQYDCSRYGILTIENNVVIKFHEKESGVKDSYINAGCYFFKSLAFFDDIKEVSFSIETKFENYLDMGKDIGIYRYNDIFIDIGIPEDYRKMQEYIGGNNE